MKLPEFERDMEVSALVLLSGCGDDSFTLKVMIVRGRRTGETGKEYFSWGID